MPAPLLLLAGLMCDARVFARQIARLSRRRAVMFAPLLRGRTVGEMAETALHEAPSHVALAGLGLGGMVAMEMMRMAPERVTRIALISTSPLPETTEAAALRERHIVAARAGRLAEAMAGELRPGDLAEGPGRDAAQALVVEMAEALGADAYVRQARALQRRPDQQETLRRIAVPALVLCGRAGGANGLRAHRFMQGLIPGAALEVIDGAGCLPTIEAPEAANAALDRWLSDTLLLAPAPDVEPDRHDA